MTLNSDLVERFQLPAVAAVSPAAYLALEGAWRAAESSLDSELFALIVRQVETLLDPGESTGTGSEAADGYLAAARAVVEQFVDYVPDIDAELLAPVLDKLGKTGLRSFIEAIYTVDQTTRLRVAHRRLLGDAEFTADFPQWPADRKVLTPIRANNLWHDTILAPGTVKPEAELSTFVREIVRLRAGWYHHCDLCNSLRLVEDGVPVVDGATDQLVMQSNFEASDLSAATKAALRYADVYMTDPANITDAIKEDLFAHFTRDQVVQLTLELSSWNYQKTLVALRIDKAVHEGKLTAFILNDHGTVTPGAPLS